jgi:hypothetical protein
VPQADPAGSAVLEADLLADEDDVDAAGQFLVDLQDLPDLAVLPVGGLRIGAHPFADPFLAVRDELGAGVVLLMTVTWISPGLKPG